MIPAGRENELLFYWQAETPEAWSQEWREELSGEERERLFHLQKAREELRRLEQDIRSARHYFGIVERRAKAIAEAAEKEEM